jgi:hypothetical protein
MPFRQNKSLKHVPLPIAGHTLMAFTHKALPTLEFSAPDGLRSDLRIAFEVVLSRPDGSRDVVTGTRPGMTSDFQSAYEVLSLLIGQVAISAFAHSNGQLEITFDDGTVLEVQPDNYEAWHFQQPAPYSRVKSDRGYFSLTGYGGGLI